MVSRVLDKKGALVLEVITVLLIMGAVFAIAIPNTIGRRNTANYMKTVSELNTLAEACVNYYVFEGAWPTTIVQLAPQFIPHAVTVSPFGTNYQISGTNNMATASVLVPAGIAPKNPLGGLAVIMHQGAQDQIQITRTVRNEFTSRLNYDLKYTY
jgi:competence protein ComGC